MVRKCFSNFIVRGLYARRVFSREAISYCVPSISHSVRFSERRELADSHTHCKVSCLVPGQLTPILEQLIVSSLDFGSFILPQKPDDLICSFT